MNTVRQYNILRRDYMPREIQKDHIKKYFGNRFIDFLKCDDRRYISLLVRV